jgi:hypothetical protein
MKYEEIAWTGRFYQTIHHLYDVVNDAHGVLSDSAMLELQEMVRRATRIVNDDMIARNETRASEVDSDKEDLKLYVWEEVLCEYECGIICVLAKDEEQARELVHKSNAFAARTTSGLSPRVVSKPEAFVVYGSS